MLEVKKNIDLQNFNTLSVPSRASYFYILSNITEIPDVVNYAEANQLPLRVLGGGSNLILSREINALVLRNEIVGKKILKETSESVLVQVSAGENWHELVSWAVEHGFSGIENLASIPGSVGAAPVQNIGAYGVEVSDSLIEVEAYDVLEKTIKNFTNEECRFGYRDSMFKRLENRFIITSLTLRLHKEFTPQLNYGPLKHLLQRAELTQTQVFNSIVEIRSSKLPDPLNIPNAGSFFKNPIIDSDKLQLLIKAFPTLVHFPFGDDHKVAAGWLIDQAGLKGKSSDEGVGCYAKQALVLVNPKKAGADKVLEWVSHIQQKVRGLFDIDLEIEPREW